MIAFRFLLTALLLLSSPLASAVEVAGVGDGVADDTAAVQAAVDAATAEGGDRVVTLPAGKTFAVRNVSVPGSLRVLRGPGGLRLLPESDRWARILTIAWDADQNSPGTLIEGIRFDGNLDRQNWQGGYDLEHQTLVFCSGRNKWAPKPGRLVVTFRACAFADCASDGLYVHHHVDATLADSRGGNCFRGVAILSGDRARLALRNVVVENTDSRITKAFDCEPNSAAHPVELSLAGCTFGGDCDFYLPQKSRASIVGCDFAGTLRINCHASMGFDGCRFARDVRIRLPGPETRFADCRFERDRPAAGGEKSEAAMLEAWCISVDWFHRSQFQNQRLVIADSTFAAAEPSSWVEGETLWAINSGRNALEWGNVLRVDDCHVAGRPFVAIARLNRDGRIRLRNVTSDAPQRVLADGKPQNFEIDDDAQIGSVER